MKVPHTIIIAEAGVNHNGELTLAKKLVDLAHDAGADYIKFQSFSAHRLVTKDAQLAEYQKQYRNNISQYEMLKSLEFTKNNLIEIVKYCENKKIGFLSTGFDIQSVAELENLNMDYIKIPSGEINNLPYIRYIGSLKNTRIILSTGMSDSDEIGQAINILISSGADRSQITVLHCTSEYPAPFEDINLNALATIKEAHKVEVGYSDHSNGIEVAIAAVAKGATIIEKHFTLDRNMEGPDHKASLEPKELSLMIQSIRNIEKALGDGEKRLMDSEIKNVAIVRKSIVAARQIHKGEVFTENNLNTKRPGNGISPMMWDDVIGEYAKRDFELDEMIEL